MNKKLYDYYISFSGVIFILLLLIISILITVEFELYYTGYNCIIFTKTDILNINHILLIFFITVFSCTLNFLIHDHYSNKKRRYM